MKYLYCRLLYTRFRLQSRIIFVFLSKNIKIMAVLKCRDFELIFNRNTQLRCVCYGRRYVQYFLAVINFTF